MIVFDITKVNIKDVIDKDEHKNEWFKLAIRSFDRYHSLIKFSGHSFDPKALFSVATLISGNKFTPYAFFKRYFKKYKPTSLTNKQSQLLLVQLKTFNPMIGDLIFTELKKLITKLQSINSIEDTINDSRCKDLFEGFLEEKQSFIDDIISDYVTLKALYMRYHSKSKVLDAGYSEDSFQNVLSVDKIYDVMVSSLLLPTDEMYDEIVIDKLEVLDDVILKLATTIINDLKLEAEKSMMSKKRWTEKDGAALIEMINRGLSIERISKELNRLESSIISKITSLRHTGEFIYLRQLPERQWLDHDNEFLKSIMIQFNMYHSDSFFPKIVKTLIHKTGRKDTSIIRKIYETNREFTTKSQSDFLDLYIEYLKDRNSEVERPKLISKPEQPPVIKEVIKTVEIKVPAYYMIPGEPQIVPVEISITKQNIVDKIQELYIDGAEKDSDIEDFLRDMIDSIYQGGNQKSALIALTKHTRNNVIFIPSVNGSSASITLV